MPIMRFENFVEQMANVVNRANGRTTITVADLELLREVLAELNAHRND